MGANKIERKIFKKVGSNISPSVLTDNVGIGTASPVSVVDIQRDTAGNLLNVERTGTFNNRMYLNAAGGSPKMVFDRVGTQQFSIGISGTSLQFADSTDLTNQRLVIDSSGNVGIGTIEPVVKLDVDGAIAVSGGSTLNKAMSGDMVLECSPATAGSSAATLNAAAAGTFTVDVTINLKDAAGALHKWASLAVNAATSEVVADADVAAPTVSDTTPDLVNGTVTVTLTYDTDAGATKTYAAGDTVTLTVSQPTGGILGYAIADATFVDTIVA